MSNFRKFNIIDWLIDTFLLWKIILRGLKELILIQNDIENEFSKGFVNVNEGNVNWEFAEINCKPFRLS